MNVEDLAGPNICLQIARHSQSVEELFIESKLVATSELPPSDIESWRLPNLKSDRRKLISINPYNRKENRIQINQPIFHNAPFMLFVSITSPPHIEMPSIKSAKGSSLSYITIFLRGPESTTQKNK